MHKDAGNVKLVERNHYTEFDSKLLDLVGLNQVQSEQQTSKTCRPEPREGWSLTSLHYSCSLKVRGLFNFSFFIFVMFFCLACVNVKLTFFMCGSAVNEVLAAPLLSNLIEK